MSMIALDFKNTRLNETLVDIRRCPHCSVAAPLLNRVWRSDQPTTRHDQGPPSKWGAYVCTSCGGVIVAKGDPDDKVGNPKVIAIFPAVPAAHEDLPPIAKTFLQQAMDTLHSPDAAAVMAGSAVDAMLKKLGYSEGSVYTRIDQAMSANILTKGMADWAHSVRLGANRPRHADQDRPHVSPEEARQSVEFAEALGTFLFVLTAKIERGIAAAKHAEVSAA